MKRLLVAARANPERWQELFRNQLPSHEILAAAPKDDATIAYVVVGRPPAGLIRSLPGLEVVLSLNAGIEHLLAHGEVPAGIPIVRLVDEGLTAGMVDWVLAQTLAWHRNLFTYRTQQGERRCAPLPEKLARDRRVTVLGAGVLATPVIELLLRFGFATRFWSRTAHHIEGATGFAGREKLAAAVEGSDVLINLLPLTPETSGLLDRFVFERLAPGAFVINAARRACEGGRPSGRFGGRPALRRRARCLSRGAFAGGEPALGPSEGLRLAACGEPHASGDGGRGHGGQYPPIRKRGTDAPCRRSDQGLLESRAIRIAVTRASDIPRRPTTRPPRSVRGPAANTGRRKP